MIDTTKPLSAQKQMGELQDAEMNQSESASLNKSRSQYSRPTLSITQRTLLEDLSQLKSKWFVL